jgi:hypothetical protein
MARYGAKKLYLDLKDDFKKNDIKMGRDRFIHFKISQFINPKNKTISHYNRL